MMTPMSGLSGAVRHAGDVQGRMVIIARLSARPELNGRIGRVLGIDADGDRFVVELTTEGSLMPSGSTVRVRFTNAEPTPAPPLPAAYGEFEEREHKMKQLLSAYNDEVGAFAEARMRDVASWWALLGVPGRSEVLLHADEQLQREVLIDENLLPEFCVELLASNRVCACAGGANAPCAHFIPLRLLHEVYISRLDESIAFKDDLRVVRNLASVGSIASPAVFGPYGTVCSPDGRRCLRLEQPVSTRPDLVLALEQEGVMWAHIRAAALNRRLVILRVLSSVCKEFRWRVLNEGDIEGVQRLGDAGGLTDLRSLDQYVKQRDRLGAAHHPESHFALAPEPGAAALPALRQQLQAVPNAEGRLRRDPVSRELNLALRHSKVCEACGKPDALLVCGGCKQANFCGARCQAECWREHKESCRSQQQNVRASNDLVRQGAVDVACFVSPCDFAGGYDLLCVLVGGAVRENMMLVLLRIRLGHGVENTLLLTDTTPAPEQRNSRHIAELFIARPWMVVRFTAFLSVPPELALGLIESASAERLGKGDVEAVSALSQGLRAFAGEARSGQAKSALADWLRAPIADDLVLRLLRDVGKGSVNEVTSDSLNLEGAFSLMLWNLEANAFKPNACEPLRYLEHFDAATEVRAAGCDPAQLETVLQVLGVLAEVDGGASGALRKRLKRVFEFEAAWLFSGSTSGFVGSSPLVQGFHTPEAKTQISLDIALCLHAASVQCSSSLMFSRAWFADMEPGDSGSDDGRRSFAMPTAGERQRDAAYQRNPGAACALAIALALRFMKAQGREFMWM